EHYQEPYDINTRTHYYGSILLQCTVNFVCHSSPEEDTIKRWYDPEESDVADNAFSGGIFSRIGFSVTLNQLYMSFLDINKHKKDQVVFSKLLISKNILLVAQF
ncbi:hypothetical protein ACJX0J_038544, partial [Zea mays]